MLTDEKILVTGPAGRIAYALTAALARDNEVWGIARFGDAEQRREVDALGVRTVPVDLYDADFSELPDDFTYVLHIAVALEHDYDRALRVNAEGTGMLLAHCRTAKAALVMSTASVYRPVRDPRYAYCETDALGDPLTHPSAPAYPVSKIAQEAVARYCSRAFELPVTIARMNAAYGPRGGLPLMHVESLLAGQPVVTRSEACAYTPIHTDDIVAQVQPLLDAAAVPATIVNWGGDEVVTVQEWTTYAAELLGRPASVIVEEIPGGPGGMVTDNRRRLDLTGPCTVPWRHGLRTSIATRHPADLTATQGTGC